MSTSRSQTRNQRLAASTGLLMIAALLAACAEPASNFQCRRYVGAVTPLITNEIVDVKWSDNTVGESGYQVVTRQIAIPAMTETIYDLPADSTRLTYISNDFVVELPQTIVTQSDEEEDAFYDDFDSVEACAFASRPDVSAIVAAPGQLDIEWTLDVLPDLVTGHVVTVYDSDPFFGSPATALATQAPGAGATSVTIGGILETDVVVVVETCFGGSLAGQCEPVHTPAAVSFR